MTNPYQSGFVSIIGYPNSGKSTLFNCLVKQDLSIITPKVQTTRQSVCGIVSESNFQIVYTDTPGIIEPVYALHRAMMQELNYVLLGTDVVLYIVDARDESIPPLIDKVCSSKENPIILLINKVDLLTEQEITDLIERWQKKLDLTRIIPISAKTGINIEEIQKEVLKCLPKHPAYYEVDSLTDKSERFFAAEIIRAQVFQNYQKEVPYAVEVGIELFKELPNITHIHAVIYTEKKSQKAILIGKNGAALKEVGIQARKSLETFLGNPVYLQQRVKVLPNWRSEKKTLERLGYNTPSE